MPSKLDIIEMAFRRLGIKAEDESLTADQRAYAEQVIDALHAEISSTAALPFWPDEIPNVAAIPFANLLAAEIGPSYMVATEPRSTAFVRLIAAIRSDDRGDATAEYF